jgi:hypothetical protein
MNYIKYKVVNINQFGGNQENISDINYRNQLFIFNNFFSDIDFSKIKNFVKNLKFKDDDRVSARKTLCLDQTQFSKLYEIIYNNSRLKSFIKTINPNEFHNPPRFPIEYRIYPRGSSGMNWHQDTSLFSPDAIEGVITIENNSKSEFKWKENNVERKITPQANTVALVKPGSVLHSVSGTGNGTRTIIKFVIDFKNSKPKSEFHVELNKCPF